MSMTKMSDQVNNILAQRRFADNPMAMPPPTPEQREERDVLWDECIKRKLHVTISLKVKVRLNAIDGRGLLDGEK